MKHYPTRSAYPQNHRHARLRRRPRPRPRPRPRRRLPSTPSRTLPRKLLHRLRHASLKRSAATRHRLRRHDQHLRRSASAGRNSRRSPLRLLRPRLYRNRGRPHRSPTTPLGPRNSPPHKAQRPRRQRARLHLHPHPRLRPHKPATRPRPSAAAPPSLRPGCWRSLLPRRTPSPRCVRNAKAAEPRRSSSMRRSAGVGNAAVSRRQ